MPSGYVQLPLWIIVAGWAVILGFISYVWNRLEGRVNKIEDTEEEKLKKRAEAPLLTVQDHALECQRKELKNDERFRETVAVLKESICQEIHNLEGKIPLMIENAILRGLANGKKQKKA